MAEEQQVVPQEKKYTTFHLFGYKITPEYCSSLESNETTAMPLSLVNVPTSPANEADEDLKTHKADEDLKTHKADEDLKTHKADEDLKTHKEDSVPVDVDLSLTISGNPNLNSMVVTCAGRNKDLTEIRSLPKEEKEEEEEEKEQTRPWTITKALCMSDVNSNYRLTVDKKKAESYIVRHLSPYAQRNIQQGIGVEVKAYDVDTDTEHDLVFKRHVGSSKCYIFNGGWFKYFVERRKLKEKDTIGLFWSNVESRLHFSVLQRKT